MNGSRQALSLIARCRNAFRPTLAKPNLLQRCSVTSGHHRLLSSKSSSSSSNTDEYPKLPISAPMQFAMNVTQASFKQVEWVIKQGIERDDILQTNDAAEKILIFITECLAEGKFDVLEEKMTPEALQKARSLVELMPYDKKKDVIFPGITRKLWFSQELNYICPWRFSAENNTLILDYFGIRICATGQNAWHLSLMIPRDGPSGLSEDFKVTDFFYESYVYPDAEESS